MTARLRRRIQRPGRPKALAPRQPVAWWSRRT